MTQRKIYLAAQYERLEEMKKIRDLLVENGHAVTSRWIDQLHGQEEALGMKELTEYPSRGQKYALIDMQDISDADTMVVFTSGNGGGRGGYHTEFGMALASMKRIVIVGPRENVFHTAAFIRQYSTVDDFIAAVTDDDNYFWRS